MRDCRKQTVTHKPAQGRTIRAKLLTLRRCDLPRSSSQEWRQPLCPSTGSNARASRPAPRLPLCARCSGPLAISPVPPQDLKDCCAAAGVDHVAEHTASGDARAVRPSSCTTFGKRASPCLGAARTIDASPPMAGLRPPPDWMPHRRPRRRPTRRRVAGPNHLYHAANPDPKIEAYVAVLEDAMLAAPAANPSRRCVPRSPNVARTVGGRADS